ncbi:LacI family DNA-binding transcriptional regulator [Tessaracoccus coleopterorum]|uniref:LacI family DNA-binding transcriptional regulator n=1 Tax=Tessaracoccus coleopterorum TaxID=2714950 RepID=UPI0018D4CF1B|nr:LacI family DNA-binding transcriptional regulator [Tessaracoccus coleopterorum]
MVAVGRHTIYEVAAFAGVSIATVSRVLTKPDVVAPGTRDRVLAAVHELNYVPTGPRVPWPPAPTRHSALPCPSSAAPTMRNC